MSEENLKNIVDFPRSTEDIEEYAKDKRINLFVRQNFFKRLNYSGAKNIITFLLVGRGSDGEINFKASDVTNKKTFYQYNMGKFDKDTKRIDTDYYKEIREKLFVFISDIIRKVQTFDEGIDSVEEGKYLVNKDTKYERYEKLIVDEGGECEVNYDFNNSDMEIHTLNPNKRTIQRVRIDVVTPGISFPFPLEFTYICSRCETRMTKKTYEVASSRLNVLCDGTYTYVNAQGEAKTRTCGLSLNPKWDESEIINAYFYEISYVDGKNRQSAMAISFKDIKPGTYDAVLYSAYSSSKMLMLSIIDVKAPEQNHIKLPEQREDENYLFTLQKAFDNYIEEKTGVRIFGMYPMKVALILQALSTHLNERLLLNVMMVGDPSTGKSMLLKYYPFFLYNYYNLSSNGLSISIPGLRGTRTTITLFGKDIKIVSLGHLGRYKSIHIDEAGENKELVQNLKSFLLEDNYSYDKAGTVGISNKRSSQVNISQNLDYEHVGQYRGAIRKAYKDLNITINGIEKEDWEESWDLFLPIHKYENPQLRKIVKEKRLEFKQKQVFWIDGLDYALHERFPFYFYLVSEKTNDKLDEAVRVNGARKIISENIEVISALYTEDIENFFKSLEKYKYCEEDQVAYKKVDEIIKQYGLIYDTRMKMIYYLIVRLSRIANMRMVYTNQDYDIVRWYLETTNIKQDLAETASYEVFGPPNLLKQYEKDKVEEESKSGDSIWGLPPGEFDR